MSYAIETENLSKTFRADRKKVNAVQDLNLSVKQGSIYGFIGPNGAGKTTTIKLLMGMVTPTTGKISVSGFPPGSIEAKQTIGYLSEVSYYYNFMEGESLLKYYASLRGLSSSVAKSRIEEYLKLVGLYDRRKEKLKGYSKGMKQRFGVALALLGNPKLLILDEPTSGLDPIGRKELKDIIRTLKGRGITIFLSSHNLSEVEKICDEIGIINKGKMVVSKPISEFLDYDKKIYTVRFLDPKGTLVPILKEKGIQFRKEEDDVLRSLVPQEEFNERFSLITKNDGIIIEVVPGHGNLEESFFNLVKEEC